MRNLIFILMFWSASVLAGNLEVVGINPNDTVIINEEVENIYFALQNNTDSNMTVGYTLTIEEEIEGSFTQAVWIGDFYTISPGIQVIDIEPHDALDVLISFHSNGNKGKQVIRMCGYDVDGNETVCERIVLISEEIVLEQYALTLNINLYPNPTNSILYLYGVPFEMEVDVYNFNGDLVWDGLVKDSIDLSGLERGVYLVRIRERFYRVILV